MNNSTVFRIILSLILFLSFVKNSKAQTTGNCEEIKVEIEVINTSEGKNNGMVKLKFENDFRQYNIHLLKTINKNQLNANRTTIDNLEQGKYVIVVTGKDERSPYCPKNIEFNIK